MTDHRTTQRVEAPESSWDPYSLDVLAAPEEMCEELRDLGPVFFLPQYGVYGMARFGEVRDALIDWQSLESGSGVGLANLKDGTFWRTPSPLLEADPPQHDAPRHVLESLLSQRALGRFRSGWEAAAKELVDRVVEGPREFDAYTEIAQPFPLSVFPDAIGVGVDGRENLLLWADMMFNGFGPRNELVQRTEHLQPEVGGWVQQQCLRENVTPDGIAEAVYAMADAGEITAELAPACVRPILSAGLDTTITGISAMLVALATTPGAWRRLGDEPQRLRVAFDEAVRWASPIRTFFRTATCDMNIAGVDITEGERVLLFLGAANHDPRRWIDPGAFDLDRDPSGHVGFGAGIHQCVGQHVARLEAEIIMTELLSRIDEIELTGTPGRHLNNNIRGWSSIPVRVTVK